MCLEYDLFGAAGFTGGFGNLPPGDGYNGEGMGIKRSFDNRADIIQALAATEGATEENLKTFSESKWDAGTGTYYCHGKMFSKMSIFRAKNYFADQAAKYNKIGTSEAKEMAQMFDLAYEAIDAIEHPPERQSGAEPGSTEKR